MSYTTSDGATFAVGTEVQLKRPSVSPPMAGGAATGVPTARIDTFLPDLADGAVKLDAKLDGIAYWNTSDLVPSATTQLARLLEVADAMQAWIDAVPDDVTMPTMPGFDRDWADDVRAVARDTLKEST